MICRHSRYARRCNSDIFHISVLIAGHAYSVAKYLHFGILAAPTIKALQCGPDVGSHFPRRFGQFSPNGGFRHVPRQPALVKASCHGCHSTYMGIYQHGGKAPVFYAATRNVHAANRSTLTTSPSHIWQAYEAATAAGNALPMP